MPRAGKATRAKPEKWHARTIGDVARIPVEDLKHRFGRTGDYRHRAVMGQDDSPIVTDWSPKSIPEGNASGADTREKSLIEDWIAKLCEGVARQLEPEGILACTIGVKFHYGDFTALTQTTLPASTAKTEEIRDCAIRFLREHWDSRRPLRLVGVGAHKLVESSGPRQVEFDLGNAGPMQP